MSFDSIERSNYDAIPIALYRFAIEDKAWCYNSSKAPITLPTGSDGADETYEPLPISDTGSRQTGDVSNDDLTITMPASAKIPTLFAGTPPSSSVIVTIRRMNLGETDSPIIWVGTVASVKRVGGISAEVTCRMLTSTFDRAGLRLSYSRGCPHALYDISCRVNKAAYAITLAISALDGISIHAPAIGGLPAGWLNGGMVEWITDDGIMERRAIEFQSTTYVQLLGLTDGLSVGQYVTLYPGCDRTSLTCETKFNNLVNYGGFPHLPGKSPFDGDPVF
jgi:uncharacterized phage protein (TIGR02218 family)